MFIQDITTAKGVQGPDREHLYLVGLDFRAQAAILRRAQMDGLEPDQVIAAVLWDCDRPVPLDDYDFGG